MNYPVDANCTVSQCESARDIPEVRRALGNIDAVICRYDHLVGRLADRLSCITAPIPPAVNDAKEPSYQTSLANELDVLQIRLRDITNDLESIYERLEI